MTTCNVDLENLITDTNRSIATLAITTLLTVIEDNSEAKVNDLTYLCDFIEDGEHTSLAVRILHLLGQEGPRTANPSRYICFIYNRVLLENATVRAAAVSAIAWFCALCDDLLPNVLVLLSRCIMDSDDEVRDREEAWISVKEELLKLK